MVFLLQKRPARSHTLLAYCFDLKRYDIPMPSIMKAVKFLSSNHILQHTRTMNALRKYSAHAELVLPTRGFPFSSQRACLFTSTLRPKVCESDHNITNSRHSQVQRRPFSAYLCFLASSVSKSLVPCCNSSLPLHLNGKHRSFQCCLYQV